MGVGRLLLMGLAVLACVGVYWFSNVGKVFPVNAQVIEGLAVHSSSLDMGEVWEGNALQYELPIHNQTDGVVSVLGFSTSCTCLAVTPAGPLKIPPQQSTNVQLKLDLTDRPSSTIGAEKRPFQFEIAPIVETIPNRNRDLGVWKLHGVAKSRVTLNTGGIEFGEIIHGQAPLPKKVRAIVHVPVRSLHVAVDSRIVTVNVHDKRKNQFEIVVAPQATLPIGPFKTEMKINLILPDGQFLPAATLPVTGQTQAEIQAIPDRVFFGSRPIGTTWKAVVCLQARSKFEFAVERIVTEWPDVRVDNISLQGASPGQTFCVTQRIAMPGDQKSIIQFHLRKADSLSFVLPMEVSYRGEVVKEQAREERKKP